MSFFLAKTSFLHTRTMRGFYSREILTDDHLLTASAESGFMTEHVVLSLIGVNLCWQIRSKCPTPPPPPNMYLISSLQWVSCRRVGRDHTCGAFCKRGRHHRSAGSPSSWPFRRRISRCSPSANTNEEIN